MFIRQEPSPEPEPEPQSEESDLGMNNNYIIILLLLLSDIDDSDTIQPESDPPQEMGDPNKEVAIAPYCVLYCTCVLLGH